VNWALKKLACQEEKSTKVLPDRRDLTISRGREKASEEDWIKTWKDVGEMVVGGGSIGEMVGVEKREKGGKKFGLYF